MCQSCSFFLRLRTCCPCEYDNDFIHCSHVRDSEITLQKGVLWSHGSHIYESERSKCRDTYLKEIEPRLTNNIEQWKTTVYMEKLSIGSTYESLIDLETYKTITLNSEIDMSREKNVELLISGNKRIFSSAIFFPKTMILYLLATAN